MTVTYPYKQREQEQFASSVSLLEYTDGGSLARQTMEKRQRSKRTTTMTTKTSLVCSVLSFLLLSLSLLPLVQAKNHNTTTIDDNSEINNSSTTTSTIDDDKEISFDKAFINATFFEMAMENSRYDQKEDEENEEENNLDTADMENSSQTTESAPTSTPVTVFTQDYPLPSMDFKFIVVSEQQQEEDSENMSDNNGFDLYGFEMELDRVVRRHIGNALRKVFIPQSSTGDMDATGATSLDYPFPFDDSPPVLELNMDEWVSPRIKKAVIGATQGDAGGVNEIVLVQASYAGTLRLTFDNSTATTTTSLDIPETDSLEASTLLRVLVKASLQKQESFQLLRIALQSQPAMETAQKIQISVGSEIWAEGDLNARPPEIINAGGEATTTVKTSDATLSGLAISAAAVFAVFSVLLCCLAVMICLQRRNYQRQRQLEHQQKKLKRNQQKRGDNNNNNNTRGIPLGSGSTTPHEMCQQMEMSPTSPMSLSSASSFLTNVDQNEYNDAWMDEMAQRFTSIPVRHHHHTRTTSPNGNTTANGATLHRQRARVRKQQQQQRQFTNRPARQAQSKPSWLFCISEEDSVVHDPSEADGQVAESPQSSSSSSSTSQPALLPSNSSSSSTTVTRATKSSPSSTQQEQQEPRGTPASSQYVNNNGRVLTAVNGNNGTNRKILLQQQQRQQQKYRSGAQPRVVIHRIAPDGTPSLVDRDGQHQEALSDIYCTNANASGTTRSSPQNTLPIVVEHYYHQHNDGHYPQDDDSSVESSRIFL